MDLVKQGIVSLQADVANALYAHSKDTILFYILALAWNSEEDIKNSLNLSEEALQWILSHLSKKKLVTLEKMAKKLPSKTYMDKLKADCDEILELCTKWEGIDRIQRAKLLLLFFSELTGRTFTNDTIEVKLQKKQDQWTFQQILEAIWRNHHNMFCNWANDQKWHWDLTYLARPDTDKSQPLEKSLKRWLDVPVPDKSLELLKKFSWAIPALSYILSIPCTYENSRNTIDSDSEEEILRQQREIKWSLGLDIESL